MPATLTTWHRRKRPGSILASPKPSWRRTLQKKRFWVKIWIESCWTPARPSRSVSSNRWFSSIYFLFQKIFKWWEGAWWDLSWEWEIAKVALTKMWSSASDFHSQNSSKFEEQKMICKQSWVRDLSKSDVMWNSVLTVCRDHRDRPVRRCTQGSLY